MVFSSKLKKKILITGGSSRFFKFLKNEFLSTDLEVPSKKKFNILKFNQLNKYIYKKKFTHLIHIAGLSRPMSDHEENINKSIDLNIIGTANIVKLCCLHNIKLIYFSTNYVYPGTKGYYKESDSVKPINNYAWSKLGGECAVQMYKNSLILRICMTDFPFVHKKAIYGAFSSFVFNKTIAKIIPFLLEEKGVLNLGGKRRDIFQFAKKFASNKIKKIHISKVKNFPRDSSVNISKLKKLITKFRINNIII